MHVIFNSWIVAQMEFYYVVDSGVARMGNKLICLNLGFIRCMVQQHADPNQWHAAICIDTMEVMKPMDIVFKWPSMSLIIDNADAYPTLNDLDFSLDGRFLVSLEGGPCRIWDVKSATVVASLLRENFHFIYLSFTSCRFSVNGNGSQILYITSMRDRGGSIVSFDTSSWTRVSPKHVVPNPISVFSVSPDTEHLAINTRVTSIIKKAHLGLVTALKFSEDSRLLVSASMDSSVRVTNVEEDMTLEVIRFIYLSNIWLFAYVIMMIAIIFLLAYYHWNDKPLPFAY
ncbi:hypothetical protein MKW92_024726 [Papaver armeniacum]|nr:hypothetical protein MKW92_024726 [Papaver armeniacum]